MKKKLTIIIPTYNRVNYLKKCINSIINQIVFNKLETEICIKIGNNASNDNTDSFIKSVIKEYPNIEIVYINRIENIGGVNNLLDLLKNLDSEFVLPLGDDNLICLNTLPYVLKLIKENNFDVYHFNAKEYKGLFKFNLPLSVLESARLLFYSIGNYGTFVIRNSQLDNIIEENIESLKETAWPQTEIMFHLMIKSKEKKPLYLSDFKLSEDIGHSENVFYNSWYIAETMFFSLFRTANVLSNKYKINIYDMASKSIYANRYWKKTIPLFFYHVSSIDNDEVISNTKKLIIQNFKIIKIRSLFVYILLFIISFSPKTVNRFIFNISIKLGKYFNENKYKNYLLYKSKIKKIDNNYRYIYYFLITISAIYPT